MVRRRKIHRAGLIGAGLLLAAMAGGSTADVRIDFRPGFDPGPEQRQSLSIAVLARLHEATDFLGRRTDYRLDPDGDVLHFMVGPVRDSVGFIIPACYTFPDSTLRIAPEYLAPMDRDLAERILSGFVRLQTPWEEILAQCSRKEREEVLAVVREFIVSELVHELYHDWQNRQQRWSALERGKTILNHSIGGVGANWKPFLEARGVDMKEHDEQVARAELECCAVQSAFWKSLYGLEPAHPLARSFLRLMEAAAVYYEGRSGMVAALSQGR